MKMSTKALVGAAALSAIGSLAHGGTVYGFTRITNNAGATNPASQFTVDVGGGNPSGVSFVFRNLGPIASVISEIYFQTPTLTVPVTITNGPGVDFAPGATPGNLPGGNTVGFTTTASLLASANNPSPSKGVNVGEFVAVTLQFGSGETLAGFLSKLDAGTARIGIHVQGIGTTGQSDSFVLGGTPGTPGSTIPLPSGACLGLAGMACVAGRRRRS